MAAVTGRLPAIGDLVWITERALLRPGDRPVRRWRVIAVELDPDRPGCCRLLGWDADQHGRPGHEGESWRTVAIAGLTIRPGGEPVPSPGPD